VFSNTTLAKNVELETAQRRTVEASFLPGDEDKSPILILHGFLQTRDFPTVNRLALALNEAGHTVLSPTLSLGLNRRQKSIACEAIHTHSLDSDTDEIKQWVEWLYQKTGKPVTLIGHSQGSQTLLNYINQYDKQYVGRAIFISMSYFAEGPVAFESIEQAEKARASLAAGYNPMDTYGLAYCKTYPTTAKAFLSYYNWNRKKVAELTAKYSESIHVIIGTGDKRIDADWRKQLAEDNISVIAIDGANHFFDQAHEFDLLDTMESLLESS
jgi:pimeloyl-ACP methyl ester carboxylesterase